MKTRPTTSRKSVHYVTKELKPAYEGEDCITDRQERIPGFDQGKLSASRIVLIGCGGLGSEIGEGLVRKGIGTLTLLDHDIVEISNLNRQKFYEKDLYRGKALQLAENLAEEGFSGTNIYAHAMSLQEAVSRNIDLGCDVAICAGDNDPLRVSASKYFGSKGIPVVTVGVDELAEHGYVFVHEPGQACFGCVFPHVLDDLQGAKCPGTGAVKDILKVIAGIVLYAVDSLIMDRKRQWNYRETHLAGFVPDVSRVIERRENCPLCEEIIHLESD